MQSPKTNKLWLLTAAFGIVGVLASCLTIARADYQPAARRVVRYVGVAKASGGRIAYVEHHQNVYEGRRLVSGYTRYESESGTLIAELTSSYEFSASLPQYRFVDHRSGREEGLRRGRTWAELFFREKRGEPLRRERFDVRNEMMAGQGIHHFMREQLTQVVAHREVELRYFVPSRLDHYGMIIRAESGSKRRVQEFSLELTGLVARLFAPKATFAYDRDSAELVYYRGRSNLLTDNGDSQDVLITYRYGAQVERSAALSRLE